jgi:hypothetical protein
LAQLAIAADHHRAGAASRGAHTISVPSGRPRAAGRTSL